MTQMSDSPFDSIARLLPDADREHFFRRMAHLRDLSPNDDMLQIAEAMGFLALVTRQTPCEIAAERQQFQVIFGQSVAAFEAAHSEAVAYQKELDQRLAELPDQIARSINPEAIAALLSEILRQHFQETGLPAAAEIIGVQVQTLRQTSKDFSIALHQLADPEKGAVSRIHRAISSMQSNVDNAAGHVRALMDALGGDLRQALAVLCAGSLGIGFFLGILYMRWLNSH